MRTAEDSSGTVLHRLIQEQLRYGNLTDTRTLLAIQQQALRGGSSGGGTGSPRSSLESLTQEETQYIQMSTRQEPQGQEHQGDCLHSESSVCHLYQLHGEELPTYEEAKAHSQYLISQKEQAEQESSCMDIMGSHSEGQWDLKREHARSLSERLMQLTLERNAPRDNLGLGFSNSYPQLYSNNATNAIAADRQGVQQCVDQRGPPPDYPFCASLPGYMLSHSQEHGQFYRDPPPPFYAHHSRYVSAQSQVAHSSIPAASSHNSAQSDVLIRENGRLRKELEVYAEKAVRLQKLELEIQRISEAYETLMKGSAKRETLEKTMRNKLEAEIKRMHDFNRDLREQLDTATKQRAAKEAECVDQTQHVFVKLLEQKEEQQRERERLERQVQLLHISGEECQRRRELLEQGLASAQARNWQLEEELQRKRAYVEKVERLQSSLGQLQAACEKREVLELRLRTRLEHELKSLRAQQSQKQAADPTASGLSSSTSQQQQLREKEERILALEADITKWEQKYLEESTMRQFAMDAAATAAAQRDTTIIKHSPRHSPNNSFNEDLPLSNHRHQEMENRIRALHAQLLEKDAVIKVLQQRSKSEQGKLERQGLRLARSVPSINTVSSSTETKGKSLSDDLTGAAVLHPRPCAVPKGPSRDSSTQCDEVPQELETSEGISAATTDASEEPKAPLKTFKSVNSSDAELVEILI
ncbi:angiomotin-like 2a isoform X1 [Hippoglossus hippoglossus]|uniref:angiomotin-like 2a isoform X1 n=1 Tax=Hippoglossus hippoglossus TaxID=8267 RepID=UPI00148C6C76|nr:angiomotin-like 2a isoform X1 [Hippoglossus hippoglossus]XP_034439081.1 angiomotin-like 2a isoform X1 [Hippoglossus hippoglossus]